MDQPGDNHRFDVFKQYERDEFVSRLQALLIQAETDSGLYRTIETNLKWAKGLPEEAMIYFEIRGDIIFPVADYVLPLILPADDGLTPNS